MNRDNIRQVLITLGNRKPHTESEANIILAINQLVQSMATPEPSLLNHIYIKVSEVERAAKCVCVLQFAIHPEGLAMVLRCYHAATDKEHSFTDVILTSEAGDNEKEIKRIDVLFDNILKALNSLQVVKAGAGGLLH